MSGVSVSCVWQHSASVSRGSVSSFWTRMDVCLRPSSICELCFTLFCAYCQRWAVPNYFSTKLLYRITFSVPPLFFKICTFVSCVSVICSEINVRRKSTCFVPYRCIDRVVSYLFSPKFLVRCQVDSNKKTTFPF